MRRQGVAIYMGDNDTKKNMGCRGDQVHKEPEGLKEHKLHNGNKNQGLKGRITRKGTIRFRLVIVFVFTTGVMFFVNMFIYYNINKSISRIDEVYVSIVGLNELLDSLTMLHEYVYEYLNTKSSDALENYYRSGQNYRNLWTSLTLSAAKEAMT